MAISQRQPPIAKRGLRTGDAGSARAGRNFVPLREAEVSFAAGERQKTAQVQLLDDHRWDSTGLIGRLVHETRMIRMITLSLIHI